MGFGLAYRSIRFKPVLASLLPRPSSYIYSPVQCLHHTSIFQCRHLLAVAGFPWLGGALNLRNLSTHQTTSSLNDPNPNWSNRPPKETILLDGCDFEHWLVVMEKPAEEWTRDQIIDYYVKTLASVIGSEEEARMKIYSVSTRCYFAFGALVSEELSYKIKELPKVRWVLPDSYLDVKNKDYGGEPFINGQAVPYDPKYHEEWIRNNSQAMMRNERNKRRGFDRRNRRDIQSQPPSGGGMPYRDSTVPNMGGAQQPSGQSGGMQFNPNSSAGLSGNPQPSGGGMQFNTRGPPSYPQPTGNGMPPGENPRFFPHTGGGMPNAGGTQQPSGVGDMPQSGNMGWRPQSPQSAGIGWNPESNNVNLSGQLNQTGQTSHPAGGMGWAPQSQVAGGPPQANITGPNYHPGNPPQFNDRWPTSSTGNPSQFNDRWPTSSTGNPPQFNIGRAPPRPSGMGVQQNDISGTPSWARSGDGNASNFQNFGDPTQETKHAESNKTSGQ